MVSGLVMVRFQKWIISDRINDGPNFWIRIILLVELNAIITERISRALSGTYDYKDPTLEGKHVRKV